MLVEVLAGAAISLVLLVVVLGYVVRRSPQLFVAERLAERIHDDGARVGDAGPDGSGPDGYE